MTSNIYAKAYRTEPPLQKNEKYAFISYMDEANSFSVVSVKRLIDIDTFGKGSIREKNKNYRITVERTGTLAEMEQLAKEAEEACAYTMNADVVSDTDEWHKRKQAVISKTQQQTSVLDKRLTDLQAFDFDENRTYTTLTTCVLDELGPIDTYGRASSDENDDDNDESNDEQQGVNKIVHHQGLIPSTSRKSNSKRKKRTVSTAIQGPSVKRSRTETVPSAIGNSDKVDVDPSSLSSLCSALKESSNNLIQLRKQVVNLGTALDQQRKTLNELLINQKKMAKAMRNHRIPIALLDETEGRRPTATDEPRSVIYQFNNNDQIDLVRIPGDPAKPNKFVLRALEKLFKDEELLAIDARSLETDDRVLAIRDAVQTKFGLTHEETETVWIPMIECIKSKRRNLKGANARKTIKPNNSNLNNSVESQSTQSL